MSDFVSEFWSLYVAGLTILSLVWIVWFVRGQTTRKLDPGQKAEVI